MVLFFHLQTNCISFQSISDEAKEIGQYCVKNFDFALLMRLCHVKLNNDANYY